MKIGFLYNLYHKSGKDEPEFFLEIDADGQDTVDAMVGNLEKKHKVFPIEADSGAFSKLESLKGELDLVFNYSIGIYGEDRYAHLPSIMEMLRIPYTGAGPLTQALVLNKAKMGEVLSVYGVGSPRTVRITKMENLQGREFSYPSIVKPQSQGSSAGITVESIVRNFEELRKQVGTIIRDFKMPALVQPFIEGREITVSLIGNPPVILPLAEFDFSKFPKSNSHFLPYEWDVGNFGDDFVVAPAKVSTSLRKKIEWTVLTAWEALGLRDCCRIDLRIDKDDNVFVLDANSPPSLVPPEIVATDPMPVSAKAAGWDYSELLDKIIEAAIGRYNKAKSGKI